MQQTVQRLGVSFLLVNPTARWNTAVITVSLPLSAAQYSRISDETLRMPASACADAHRPVGGDQRCAHRLRNPYGDAARGKSLHDGHGAGYTRCARACAVF